VKVVVGEILSEASLESLRRDAFAEMGRLEKAIERIGEKEMLVQREMFECHTEMKRRLREGRYAAAAAQKAKLCEDWERLCETADELLAEYGTRRLRKTLRRAAFHRMYHRILEALSLRFGRVYETPSPCCCSSSGSTKEEK